MNIDFLKRYAISLGIISTSIVNATNQIPIAIIGGQGDAPYSAFVEHPDAWINPLELPATGLTYRVGINSSGQGLIGGTDGVDAYAAFAAPNGTVTPLSGLITPGEIYTVAINESNIALIGGGHQATNIPYAAYASTNGTVTPISGLPANGLIYGVALDNLGSGIIGGIGPANSAYAALVLSNGASTPLTGLPANGGIFWVAANDSGQKFISGTDGPLIYAAFVSPNGTVDPVASLPPGTAYSAAMNSKNESIIGGTSSSQPYAALVRPDGSIINIDGLPQSNGIIYNVAVNEPGKRLIAGFSADGPYGAFVLPNGKLIRFKNLPQGIGFLDGAALHSSGVAMVGGTSFGVPFLAVVAPNGTLTYLPGLPSQGEINSIALAALDDLVPERIGPYDSWANTQFTLSNVLVQHNLIHREEYRHCLCLNDCEKRSSIWMTPFGNYLHQKHRQGFPSYTNKIGGGIVGYDYNYTENVVIGGALAYTYNDIHFLKNFGHGRIHQKSAVLYTTFQTNGLYINAAVWGGYYRSSSLRKSLSFIKSHARPKARNVNPHFEVGLPCRLKKRCGAFIEPFIAFDWASNWEFHHCEKGHAGFNLKIADRHSSILRSEAGVRFYQSFYYDWGYLVLLEKASYVNRTTTRNRKARVGFIKDISTFEVETLCKNGQNHGVMELHIECIPTCLTGFYGSLDYMGEFGSSFQSQTLTFGLGKNF